MDERERCGLCGATAIPNLIYSGGGVRVSCVKSSCSNQTCLCIDQEAAWATWNLQQQMLRRIAVLEEEVRQLKEKR